MSYIGNTQNNQNYVPAVDYFNGNGSTTAFTLSRPVASVAAVQAVINNVPQNPGDAFTVSGSTITFTSAPPSGTNNIYVYYTSPNTQVVQPGQGTVGTTQLQSDLTLTNPTYTGTLTGGTGVVNIGSGQVYKDSSGNVGIGTSSPQQKLQVYSSAASGGQIQVTNSSTGAASTDGVLFGYDGLNDVTINNQEATATKFYTSGSERMRIDSSGNLFVGMTSTSSSPTYGGMYFRGDNSSGGVNWYAQMYLVHKSTNNHGIAIKEIDAGGGNAMGFLNSSDTLIGSISTSATTTAYNTSSDYRLKENIQPMQNALDVVAQLNPVTYTWKADGSDGQGFIAHELQAVVPDCVTGEKDAVDEEGNPVYQGIDTSFLVATLTKAIQELKAEVDDLKAQLEAK